MDFRMCLPSSYTGIGAVLTVVHSFSRMPHSIPCRQTVTANQTAQLLIRETRLASMESRQVQ